MSKLSNQQLKKLGKPFLQFHALPEGIVAHASQPVPTDQLYTAVVVMVQDLMRAGYTLDSLFADMRNWITTAMAEPQTEVKQ